MPDGAAPVLDVKGLKTVFRTRGGEIHAVNSVSFHLQPGELLGVVGESGSGKSVTMMSLLGLLPAPPADVRGGQVMLAGRDLLQISAAELQTVRGAKVGFIFQDPQASLNPRMTLATIICEPLDEHTSLTRPQKLGRVYELMDAVGLNRRFANRFPHEFSGGQRQRIGIARALALNPRFIVCDEPIAALDVSIQAQVVNLLEDLQTKFGLTYLFISHDLSMVRHIADRVAVMYLGQIAELSPRDDLYANPLHPYAQALLSAANEPDPVRARNRKRIILKGDVPSPANPPKGCNFSTLCPKVFDRCHSDQPSLIEVAPGRHVACHLVTPTITTAGKTGDTEAKEHNQLGANL